MKKIPLLLAVITLMWSCGGSSTKNLNDSTKATDQIVEKVMPVAPPNDSLSLNRMPKTTVVGYAQFFADNILDKVAPRGKISTWFSHDAITEMVRLLKLKRKGAASNVKGEADGFRVYFIASNADKSDLSFAIVATTYAGLDSKGFEIHKDYYIDPNLFTALSGINEERRIGDCDGGALLYVRCFPPHCDDQDCTVVSDDHRISRSYGERAAGASGNKNINTKSVWFDFEFLESLSKISGNDFDGIRIYLANYGDHDTDGEPIPSEVDEYGNQVRLNRDAVVITPTRYHTYTANGSLQVNKKIHDDVFDCTTSSPNFSKTLSSHKKNVIDHLTSKNRDTYDNGELCPSHCN